LHKKFNSEIAFCKINIDKEDYLPIARFCSTGIFGIIDLSRYTTTRIIFNPNSNTFPTILFLISRILIRAK